jgi:hypothetical protein
MNPHRPTIHRARAVTAIGPELRDRIVSVLQKSRDSCETIAARFGVSAVTVRGIARANGFTEIGRK